MHSSSLWTLLLTGLMSMQFQSSTTHVNALNGILKVTPSSSGEFTACHECLVLSLGTKDIYLLDANSEFRIYFVNGDSYILRFFVSYCKAREKCGLSIYLDQADIPIDSSSYHRQQINAIPQPSNLEFFIHTLTTQIFREVQVTADQYTKHSTEKKHEISSFISKGVGRTPFFFFHELRARYKILQKSSIGKEPDILIHDTPPPVDSVAEINNGPLTDDQKNTLSSIRCMIVRITSIEAVCRECLAMHSKDLTIRSYVLFDDSKASSAEMNVFLSNHIIENIVTNCNITFCSSLTSLDPDDCQKLGQVLSMHHTLAHDKESIHLDEVQQVLMPIAYKRMQRIQHKNTISAKPLVFTESLRFLHSDKYFCIKITASSTERFACIKCVLGDAKVPRLVVVLSLYNA